MSQWGDKRTFNGIGFMPLVETHTWAQVSRADRIMSILTLDQPRINGYAGVVERRFKGRTYGEWLDWDEEGRPLVGTLLHNYVFTWTGVSWIVSLYKKATDQDCGCKYRRNIFNQWHDVTLDKFLHWRIRK